MAGGTRWVALLRGINLGSSRRIAMSDLRQLLTGLGYEDVKTLLQSGNAVFSAGSGTATTHAAKIAAAIEKGFGMDVKALVQSAADLAGVVKANPFVRRGIDARELHATFLSAAAPQSNLAQIDRDALLPDEFAVGKRVIYERRPSGVLASKLPDWQKLLKDVDVTARNWNTVTKLDAST